MEPGALRPYERSLSAGEPLHVRHADGRVRRLDIERWLAPADATDRRALAWARSPVLDVGCGPGRMLGAATELGRFALGVDIARTAVELSTARGHNALCRDVFGPLPGAGQWGSILLFDGNIGIGGDPVRLLTRCVELLRPGGVVVVEIDPDPACDETGPVQFTTHGEPVGPTFQWARAGSVALRRAAADAGLSSVRDWRRDGRCFAVASE